MRARSVDSDCWRYVIEPRNISSANAIMLIFSMTTLTSLFFLTLYNQGVNQYTPLQSGLAVVPIGVIMFTMARLAPRFIKAFGSKKVLMFAPLPVASSPPTGLVILSTPARKHLFHCWWNQQYSCRQDGCGYRCRFPLNLRECWCYATIFRLDITGSN